MGLLVGTQIRVRPKLIRRLEQAGNLLGLGDVGLYGDRAPPGLAHICDDALGSRLVARVVDDDVPAPLPCEPRSPKPGAMRGAVSMRPS